MHVRHHLVCSMMAGMGPAGHVLKTVKHSARRCCCVRIRTAAWLAVYGARCLRPRVSGGGRVRRSRAALISQANHAVRLCLHESIVRSRDEAAIGLLGWILHLLAHAL